MSVVPVPMHIGPQIRIWRDPLPSSVLDHCVSVAELCHKAGVKLRVSGESVYVRNVYIQDSLDSCIAWTDENHKLYIIADNEIPHDNRYLRILEILAFSFFEYASRECLCHQGYFDHRRILSESDSLCEHSVSA